jgi:hypothetical protein
MEDRPMPRNPMSRKEREMFEELFELSPVIETVANFKAGNPVYCAGFTLLVPMPCEEALLMICGLHRERVRLVVNPVVARRLAHDLESLGRNAGWWDENRAFIEARPAS